MKYLVNIDGDTNYMSVELTANVSKKVEFNVRNNPAIRKTAILTAEVLEMPTKERTGSGIVRIEYVESRNKTSQVCTIAKLDK